jgi:hypothetical protein
VRGLKQRLQASAFYGRLTEATLGTGHAVKELVCYGLGRLTASGRGIPTLQLACATLLREALRADGAALAYDPIFDEVRACSVRGLTIAQTSDQRGWVSGGQGGAGAAGVGCDGGER